MKSKDKLKSDKFQDLDIFSASKTKTPVTPYQPHRPPGQSLGKNATPVKEVEKKVEEKVAKEKQDFKTPGKVEDRRRSSSSSDKGREKEKERRHSSSSGSHGQSKDRHRHDKEMRHSKDAERRHSKDDKRSSEDRRLEKEEKKLAEEVKRAGDKERERLFRLYSSELGEDEKKDGSKDKYEKEREQQAIESKKRLQESRERKEKEVREEKERRKLKEKKEKERREKERKSEKEREAKEEKARKERLEENKNAVKEKIEALKPEELKMVLLESIVAKEGGNLDETQRKDVLRTLESAIVEKVVEKKVKSPGKNGRRSVLKGGESSDEDFTPARAKRLPKRRKVDSESDSCSDSDSDSGIKALKTRIADRRKSTEELILHSRKSPDMSTTSSRKSLEDSTVSTMKVSAEKPVRKGKPISPRETLEPSKSKSSPTKTQQSPVKSQKSPETQVSIPPKLTPKSKSVTPKKQEASGSKSKQFRSKAKALPKSSKGVDFSNDDDPTVEPLEAFKQSDIEFLLRMKDLYGRKLEKGVDALSISSVTSTELNLAIPATRTVTIDVEEGRGDDLVDSLADFGGNPRMFTTVPSWLAPHLEASRVKEEVEMPSKQEIASYLKNKASKRKAGWDIVVEVVPSGPQPKRSKLEIQLGYDSAFADSLTLSGGRRSRRPNKRYSDGANDSTASETAVNSSVESATPINEGKSSVEPVVDAASNMEDEATNESHIDAKASAEENVEIEIIEREADMSGSKMEVDQPSEMSMDELNSSVTEQTFDSVETVEEAVKSSSEESLKLEWVDTSEDPEVVVGGDTAKDESEAMVARVNMSQSAISPEPSVDQDQNEISVKASPRKNATKSKETPKSKELASLNVDSSLMVKEKNANGAVRELRKRKANNSLNSSLDQSASSCKVVDDDDFFGWAAPPTPPR